MLELYEAMTQSENDMIFSVIIIFIITRVLYLILNSFFKYIGKNLLTKTKIKKVYVDEDGDEIE